MLPDQSEQLMVAVHHGETYVITDDGWINTETEALHAPDRAFHLFGERTVITSEEAKRLHGNIPSRITVED